MGENYVHLRLIYGIKPTQWRGYMVSVSTSRAKNRKGCLPGRANATPPLPSSQILYVLGEPEKLPNTNPHAVSCSFPSSSAPTPLPNYVICDWTAWCAPLQNRPPAQQPLWPASCTAVIASRSKVPRCATRAKTNDRHQHLRAKDDVPTASVGTAQAPPWISLHPRDQTPRFAIAVLRQPWCLRYI